MKLFFFLVFFAALASARASVKSVVNTLFNVDKMGDYLFDDMKKSKADAAARAAIKSVVDKHFNVDKWGDSLLNLIGKKGKKPVYDWKTEQADWDRVKDVGDCLITYPNDKQPDVWDTACVECMVKKFDGRRSCSWVESHTNFCTC